MIPSIDFGIYYNTRTLYIGLAAEHLNQATFDISEVEPANSLNAGEGSETSKKDINIIGTFGKAFVINDKLVLKTSVLTRLSSGGISMDLNGSLLIKNKILFGISLRQNAIIVMTEINLTKSLKMGVAYDLDGSDVAKSTSGSFEVFLGYDLGLFKSKVISPRYF